VAAGHPGTLSVLPLLLTSFSTFKTFATPSY